jgi:hypothetical protein
MKSVTIIISDKIVRAVETFAFVIIHLAVGGLYKLSSFLTSRHCNVDV